MSRSSKRIAQGRAGRQQALKQILFAEIINGDDEYKILPPTGSKATNVLQSANSLAKSEKGRATQWLFRCREFPKHRRVILVWNQILRSIRFRQSSHSRNQQKSTAETE